MVDVTRLGFKFAWVLGAVFFVMIFIGYYELSYWENVLAAARQRVWVANLVLSAAPNTSSFMHASQAF